MKWCLVWFHRNSGKCKVQLFLRVWSFYSHALHILSAEDLATSLGFCRNRQNRRWTKCTEHASKKIRPSKRLELYIFQRNTLAELFSETSCALFTTSGVIQWWLVVEWQLSCKIQRISGIEWRDSHESIRTIHPNRVIRANRKFEWFGRIGLTRFENRGFNCESIDSRESRWESPVPLSSGYLFTADMSQFLFVFAGKFSGTYFVKSVLWLSVNSPALISSKNSGVSLAKIGSK